MRHARRTAPRALLALLALLSLPACEQKEWYNAILDACGAGNTRCGLWDFVEECTFSLYWGSWEWFPVRDCHQEGLHCEVVNDEATCVP